MKRFDITRWLGMGAILSLGVLPLHAQNQLQLINQNSGTQQTAPPATLQVTGTTQAFSVSANRAEVQDVLKMVFDQGQRQFTLDANATGTVSLRLINQPLKSVLDAVCSQAFLKFQIKNGVFVFSRDEEAVRRAIAQIKMWNVQLQTQLQALGLDIPPAANFYAQSRGGGAPGPQGPQGGGFGGGTSGRGYPNYLRMQASPGVQQLLNSQAAGGRAQNNSTNAPDTAKRAVQRDERGRIKDKADTAFKSDAINGNMAAGADAELSLNDGYSNMLRENGLYRVNTQGAQVPVSDILLELGRQSGMTMLLDPDLPKDNRFRLKGTLPARTFEEQLNLISGWARLEWRKIGNNTVIVSPTPEFQLFFGNDTQPKVAYPNVQNATRSRAGEPAEQKPELKKESDTKKQEPDKSKTGKGN